MKPTQPAETYRGTVYPWQCDFNNHMNVQFYVGKFDEATWHFFSILGITRAYLKSKDRGMVAVEQNITYQKEVFAGDLIHITTELIEKRSKSLVFLHRMFLTESETMAAEAKMTGVHMDLKTRKAIPFPTRLI